MEKVNKLESCAWEEIWFEIANDSDGKERILVIGDNVSSQYAYFLNRNVYQGKKYVDKCTTSKAVNHPTFLLLIDYMLMQEKNCNLIHLHSGFHNMHMTDEEFKTAYASVVRYIRENYSSYTLTVATIPPVCEEKSATLNGYNEVLLRRNKIICEIAQQEAVPIIDLHSILTYGNDLYKDDGVLLIDEGAAILAEHCGMFFEKQK